jgi:hypothetical protein
LLLSLVLAGARPDRLVAGHAAATVERVEHVATGNVGGHVVTILTHARAWVDVSPPVAVVALAGLVALGATVLILVATRRRPIARAASRAPPTLRF